MQTAARTIKSEIRRRQALLWFEERTHAELLNYLLNLLELEFPEHGAPIRSTACPPAGIAAADLRLGSTQEA